MIMASVFTTADTARTVFAGSYGSHMVLQQAPAQAVVWGFTGLAGGTLTLTLDGEATTTGTTAPYNSTALTWRALLPATPASNQTDAAGRLVPVPHALSLSKGGVVQAKLVDVLFGELWVCSGQSNMAFLLEMDMEGQRLVQEANGHPAIRFMTTRKLTAAAPLPELPCNPGDPNPGGCTEESWSVGNNISVSDNSHRARPGAVDPHSRDDNWLYMSAVCYLYGLDLHLALGVPVGLMNTNWGVSNAIWNRTHKRCQYNPLRQSRASAHAATVPPPTHSKLGVPAAGTTDYGTTYYATTYYGTAY